MSETTGTVDFTYKGETYQTWYKVVGNLKSGKTPLVTLHGGPGFSHHYMLPLIELHNILGIPIIFYDQIGIGQSTHLREKDADFWTMDLFMDELQNLLEHLEITKFDLFGHSWGAMLATDFVSIRQPAGLRRIIFSNGLAAMSLWEKSTQGLLKELPKDIQEVLDKHHAEGKLDTPEYQAAVDVFNKKHICLVNPWPEQLMQSFGACQEDPTVYTTMLGHNEFSISGTLKTWNALERLPNITQPSLVINSRQDEAQDVCVSPFFELIPKVKWYKFDECSHIPWFEQPERYFKVVSEFLSAA